MIGVDKNTTIVFPAPLMSTIGELGAFLARETSATALAGTPSDAQALTKPVATTDGTSNTVAAR
jgi:hypothetical protein